MYCKSCGKALSNSDLNCSDCGAAVPTQSVTTCPSCGLTAAQGTRFCKNCGASLLQFRVAAASVGSPATVERAVKSEVASQWVCPHCHASMPDGTKFCNRCGKPRIIEPPVSANNTTLTQRPETVTPPPTRVARAATAGSNRGSRNWLVLVPGIVLVVALLAGASIWYWRIRAHRAPEATTGAANPTAPAGSGSTSEQPQTNGADLSNSLSQGSQLSPEAGANTSSSTDNLTNGSASAPIIPGTERVTSPRNPRTAAQPPVVAPPAYQQAHMRAEQCLASAQYIDPPDNSALYWARMARQQGDPTAPQMEAQVLDNMIAAVNGQRSARNYDSAIMLLSRLTQLFPDRTDLPQMANSITDEQRAYNQQIQQQRRAEELRAQTKEFQVQHRHVMGLQNFTPVYGYCAGILRITPDGKATYNCTQPDPRGRCHNVVFTGPDLREIQINNEGMLHLASRASKFDFRSDPATIKSAFDALQTLKNKQ